MSPTNGTIRNFLLALSHLLRAVYETGLAHSTHAAFLTVGFQKDPFHTNLQAIYFGEIAHVTLLTAAVVEAGYSADRGGGGIDFPYMDVGSLVAFASLIDRVVVGACGFVLLYGWSAREVRGDV